MNARVSFAGAPQHYFVAGSTGHQASTHQAHSNAPELAIHRMID